MKPSLEPMLERWVAAQILDPAQADRIRRFEAEHDEPRSRWPVVAAAAFGALMLAAGILLFVSAHWEEISPAGRIVLLVGGVAGLHLLAAWAGTRIHAFGVALHAVGTVALGGAIAIAGQVFNMQEHWPSAILLWTVGAVAGWALLGDWPQLAAVAILAPIWLGGEWSELAPHTSAAWPVTSCAALLTAICYLSVRRPGDDRSHGRRALTWIGGLALFPAAIIVAADRHSAARDLLPAEITILGVGWVLAILLPLAFAFLLRRTAAWVNLVAALWVLGLHLAGDGSVLPYAWCAIGAAGLVGWGISEARPERINLGMSGFALTLLFFFFSSVMDKLGRSASLIALGVLCLAGGWQWEKLRRRMVAQATAGGVE